MPPRRAEGNSFHYVLYSLLTEWMPGLLMFSTSGRFVLVTDIDQVDLALSESASAASAIADSDQQQQQQQHEVPTSDSGAVLPRAGNVGRTLNMSSYSSMRRQMCAYNFHAVEPHSLPRSEIPDGIIMTNRSRVWFHLYFYRGATTWENVPRIVCDNRKRLSRSRSSPTKTSATRSSSLLLSSAAAAAAAVATGMDLEPRSPSPMTSSGSESGEGSPRMSEVSSSPPPLPTMLPPLPTPSLTQGSPKKDNFAARKSAIKYRDAIQEIKRTFTDPTTEEAQPASRKRSTPEPLTNDKEELHTTEPSAQTKRISRMSISFLLNTPLSQPNNTSSTL
ncbi:hypothetical protein GQ42DRAFT_64091 [Ramicandelaber brevisporus]|nr:hypothetical protein GQ42DRAFT_64091 [Ramicandelaber brevisporus]